ncbi:hypothetical protein [Aeromonas veronii]|uniref:hypothetical protein n=1 Tax=Aeromonas veronii TaxID=654 RepID=UPI0012F622FA|nr:hypothetical protein [Aeromonas veronii]QGW99217.1 hypothetical protein FGM04_22060 [Aeromonas veronii]
MKKPIFELDNKTICADISWVADEKRDCWELRGCVTVSDPVQASFSKWYRPDSYELQHLELSSWPEDIYRQLQQGGFLGWGKELPPHYKGGWGYFYSNSSTEKSAQQADKNRSQEAVLSVGTRMGLCTEQIEILTRIVALVREVEGKRPTVSAREQHYGY